MRVLFQALSTSLGCWIAGTWSNPSSGKRASCKPSGAIPLWNWRGWVKRTMVAFSGQRKMVFHATHKFLPYRVFLLMLYAVARHIGEEETILRVLIPHDKFFHRYHKSELRIRQRDPCYPLHSHWRWEHAVFQKYSQRGIALIFVTSSELQLHKEPLPQMWQHFDPPQPSRFLCSKENPWKAYHELWRTSWCWGNTKVLCGKSLVGPSLLGIWLVGKFSRLLSKCRRGIRCCCRNTSTVGSQWHNWYNIMVRKRLRYARIVSALNDKIMCWGAPCHGRSGYGLSNGCHLKKLLKTTPQMLF